MTNRPFRPALLSLPLAFALVAPRAALAVPPLELKGEAALGGENPILYKYVIINEGSVLNVKQLGTTGGNGRLHIKATQISINAGGVIDASGAGFRGLDSMNGEGMGGGKAMASGGGGAFFGIGGPGFGADCATTYGAGGTTYGALDVFSLGSAGGAATDMAGVPGSRGGHGGGSVILEAAEINIYGKILARGDDGLISNGVGSGGGAGGEVRLIANQINWGPNALVSVAGGLGGGGKLTKTGGSGGGGLIRVEGNGPALANIDLEGGASAKAGCSLGAGADGTLDVTTGPATCVDLDKDGHPAKPCGGSDCDDADAEINADAKEICDGVDNDCDSMVDVAPDLCAFGNACQSGKCVPTSDAGVGDGGAVPPSLSSFEYEGGCSLGRAGPGGSIAALAGLLGVLGARRARAKEKLAALLRRR
jgi:hypothetical protein